jgi:hypothetical protein
MAALTLAAAHGAERWIPAGDATQVQRTGRWEWNSHRYAAESALATREDGAALECAFAGRSVVLCLDTLTPPNNYGAPELGTLEVYLDGERVGEIRPREAAGEIVLAQWDRVRTGRVRLVHRVKAGGAGARIRGLRVGDEPVGALAFVVSGAQNGGLLDVRAVLRQSGRVVRDTLVRNWLTGACRLAALPPGEGYSLELRASGWTTFHAGDIAIRAGKETSLPAVYLERERDVPQDAFTFPVMGHAAVRLPGGSFRARFEANRAEIRRVRLVRRVGPAVISRGCAFAEDAAAAFYYHREGTITVPADTPPGSYDLAVELADERGVRTLVSPRAVSIVTGFAADPVFVSWGHLDTWGQYQAEYVERLVTVANLLAPDMVLVSNEGNPAYAAGALHGLEMPFVVNFGNHRGPEPGPWFGAPVGAVDFGTAFTVVNVGHAWDRDPVEVDTLLRARSGTRLRILNAFEANAPVRDLLDRHAVALIHYGHGPGPVVARVGATPTLRVGKSNSDSFRVIRFQAGQPVSFTYRGHATAPVPFARSAAAPVAVSYEPANDGTHRRVTARFRNDLEEDFSAARATFVLPRGAYRVSGGSLENATDSDDGKFTLVTARFDLLRKSGGVLVAQP